MELLRPGSEPARAKRHQPTGHLSWQCCDHAIIAGRDGSRQSRTQGCIIHTVVHVGQDCLTWLNRQYGIERGSEMDMRGIRPCRDRTSTRLISSHLCAFRMPSSACIIEQDLMTPP